LPSQQGATCSRIRIVREMAVLLGLRFWYGNLSQVQVQQAKEYACCVLDVRGAAKKALCHCLAVRAPFSSLIEHSPPLSLCDCN
jgi:hypothetical protein